MHINEEQRGAGPCDGETHRATACGGGGVCWKTSVKRPQRRWAGGSGVGSHMEAGRVDMGSHLGMEITPSCGTDWAIWPEGRWRLPGKSFQSWERQEKSLLHLTCMHMYIHTCSFKSSWHIRKIACFFYCFFLLLESKGTLVKKKSHNIAIYRLKSESLLLSQLSAPSQRKPPLIFQTFPSVPMYVHACVRAHTHTHTQSCLLNEIILNTWFCNLFSLCNISQTSFHSSWYTQIYLIFLTAMKIQ